MPADAGIRFGQYTLVRRIARGGMAEVFLAQQRGLEGFERRLAVKRILPHLADSPDFVKMFLSEAKLAAQLSHPNVVHIYEFGKVEHDYFIAMEYVDGVHAGQVFKHGDHERLPVTLVARIGADAAAALHYAHELRAPNGKLYGLVHRDVSPANIMISYDGVVKLCDFGIAKAAAAGDQLTNPGQVKGKYAYMSPEQTIAAPLDGRSDVFSLAIVMWELLSGKYIVPRGDAVASMRMIRDGKLEAIEKVAPHVPAPLAKALNWALEPKREKRATAIDFAQALEAFIKSSPELATSMQIAGWVRARFPREGTGQVPAIDASSDANTPHPGTQAGPGTVAAPGTSAAGSAISSPDKPAYDGDDEAPLRLPPTPPAYPPRVVKLVSSDSVEGTEIYSASDLEEQATVKAPKFPGLPPPKLTPSSAATLIAPPPISDPSIGVGDETELVARKAPDEEDSQNMFETMLRDRRSPIPSGPTVVPTRVQPSVPGSDVLAATAAPPSGLQSAAGMATVQISPSGMHVPVSPAHGSQVPSTGPQLPSGAQVPPSGSHVSPSGLQLSKDSRTAQTLKGTGTQALLPRKQSSPDLFGARRGPTSMSADEAARARRTKKILMFAGLAGLALLSFMIALAASNSSSQKAAPATRDAAIAPIANDTVDALPIAEPPVDAAVDHAPTVPIDAPPAMGLLVVRTIPDGGTVKVGDQVREAAVQPGDPTGARTAQLLLEAGRYTIEAELAGYQAEKREVVLDGGENKMIEITFTKKLTARPGGPPMGRITVRTTPWSDVYLGGKKLGQAPFADLPIPVGTHTLTFKNPSRPTVTKTVTIKTNKLTKLNFNLP